MARKGERQIVVQSRALPAQDIDRARQIYNECLNLIPHKQFTFAKIWLLKAHFEVRHFNLPAARKTLGQAIGACSKDKLFKGYISLETRLHEFSRCRTLYEKHIEFNPSNAQTWIRFAELEMALEDYDRVRAIFELAVNQELLDMPFGWPRSADAVRSDPRFAELRLHIWHGLHTARREPVRTPREVA